MSRKLQAFNDGNGLIKDPPSWLFNPFLQINDDQNGTLIYRVRRLSSSFLEQEITKLATNGSIYVAPLEGMNDLHEGTPDLAKSLTPLDGKSREALRMSASSALNDSSDFGKMYSDLTKVFGSGGLFTKDSFDYFLQPYFNNPTFSSAVKGQESALINILSEVRKNIRVGCFSLEAPSSYHWGQYGDNGNGICFEISNRYDKSFYTPLTPREVTYVSEKPCIGVNTVLTAYIFLKLLKNWNLSDLSFSSHNHPFFEAIRSIAFTKEDTWKQENECRLLNFSGRNGGYVSYSGLKLKRIILGPRSSTEDAQRIISLLRKLALKVPLSTMEQGRGYKLVMNALHY
ncbi:MAG: DUF2971 domain-containing protein [Litoreibacter sp.]